MSTVFLLGTKINLDYSGNGHVWINRGWISGVMNSCMRLKKIKIKSGLTGSFEMIELERAWSQVYKVPIIFNTRFGST